jgi:hypothetical protein
VRSRESFFSRLIPVSNIVKTSTGNVGTRTDTVCLVQSTGNLPADSPPELHYIERVVQVSGPKPKICRHLIFPASYHTVLMFPYFTYFVMLSAKKGGKTN